MAKKKLFEDIKRQPARFYRMPGDVIRDRRFGDSERLEILQAWRMADADPLLAGQIDDAIGELEHRRLAATGHAAE